jgi:glycosyltransferase involved in cell wall biosynthesis
MNNRFHEDVKGPLLSVIVPVFNEAATLAEAIRRISAAPIDKEILVIDDASTDGSLSAVNGFADTPSLQVFLHERNHGKGAAIRTGFACARGDIIVIHDADLEYNPADIERLVAPILARQADVTFGNRFASQVDSAGRPLRRIANQFLTWLSNRFTGLALSDMETCYKAMRREVAASISIRENRFGVEPELTAKIARGGWRVTEVPISYCPRDYAAGKKIGVRDGLWAIWCILRYSRWD